MMKPAGIPSHLNGAQTLAPIEGRTPRDSAAAKRLKNPWNPTINYLSELRTKKTQLFQQIQIEMQALFAEQGNASEEQQFKKREISQKFEKISSLASSADKMRALTGYVDGAGDLTKDLFVLVGLLELYSSAYLEADCYFARAHSLSTVVNPPKDRLLCYLQLVSSLKRAAAGGNSRKPPVANEAAAGGQSSQRSSSTSRQPSSQADMAQLKHADLTNIDELMKLKGVVMDEPTLSLILKNFTKKWEKLLEQERAKSEAELVTKQQAFEQVHSQLEATQKELSDAKEQVIKAHDDLTEAISATVNSDEKAQVETLQKERSELKKKLAETQKELQEAYARMSDIVQKKNAPVEQLSAKVTDLEAKVTEGDKEKEKSDERINRLQSINQSMQQMYDQNVEKVRTEYDCQIKQLNVQIASLNTELAKQRTNLSAKTSVAENVETMEETLKLTEQKFEEKVKELLQMQADLEKAKREADDKEKEIQVCEHRISEMEDQMRLFTSLASTDANDETFEAVMRAEFETMRQRLNQKNSELAAEVENLRTELIRNKGDSQAYIERLKVQMMAMSNRLLKKD